MNRLALAHSTKCVHRSFVFVSVFGIPTSSECSPHPTTYIHTIIQLETRKTSSIQTVIRCVCTHALNHRDFAIFRTKIRTNELEVTSRGWEMSNKEGRIAEGAVGAVWMCIVLYDTGSGEGE